MKQTPAMSNTNNLDENIYQKPSYDFCSMCDRQHSVDSSFDQAIKQPNMVEILGWEVCKTIDRSVGFTLTMSICRFLWSENFYQDWH